MAPVVCYVPPTGDVCRAAFTVAFLKGILPTTSAQPKGPAVGRSGTIAESALRDRQSSGLQASAAGGRLAKRFLRPRHRSCISCLGDELRADATTPALRAAAAAAIRLRPRKTGRPGRKQTLWRPWGMNEMRRC